MTDAHVADLAAVLGSTGPILLDFDGPVTTLLPPPANAELAEAARRPLRRADIELPDDLAESTDHLAVLRYAGAQSSELTNRVETVCTTGEIEAARRSTPTPGAHDAMRALRRAARPIVIVSNNATDAIETYLDRHDIVDLVSGIVGRTHGRPELMKPDTEPIDRALRILDAAPADCVLIGDSVTDIEASRRSGVRSIGYAKTARRRDRLAIEGVDAVIDEMNALTRALAPNTGT